MGVASRIKKLMRRRGLRSQLELSRASGVSQAYISRIFSRRARSVSPNVLDKIAEGLGAKLTDLTRPHNEEILLANIATSGIELCPLSMPVISMLVIGSFAKIYGEDSNHVSIAKDILTNSDVNESENCLKALGRIISMIAEKTQSHDDETRQLLIDVEHGWLDENDILFQVVEEAFHITGVVINPCDFSTELVKSHPIIGILREACNIFNTSTTQQPSSSPTQKPTEQEDPKADYQGQSWPGHYVHAASLETVSHFTGRQAELKQLKDTIQSCENIIAVIGMAGQGKSSLLTRWYQDNRSSLAADGRGLFWCSPYDTGYTYSSFLEDILPYLTKGQYDPRKYPSSSEARTDLLCSLLKQQPTLIVLDGLERWLARWTFDTTDSGKDAAADDRLSADTALDTLLKDAAGWDNGSAIIFSSRAMPAVLDDRHVMRIGTSVDGDRADLAPLLTDEAVELLKALGVKGDNNELQIAAIECECHALTLRVLAGLLVDLYGGDIGKRPEVNVLDVAEDRSGLKGRLFHLLERIEEHHTEELPLLTTIACCLVPSPVVMLASLLDKKVGTIRAHLAKLEKWELIRFDPAEGLADFHALLREYFTHRVDDELVRKIRCDIAAWYASQPIVDQPQRIEEVRPMILAVTHALEGRDVELAGNYLKRTPAGKYYSTLDDWLRAFGYYVQDVEWLSDEIGQYEHHIVQGRSELRNDLAGAYSSRGNAFAGQGRFNFAIADCATAIELYEMLVHKENRLELRNPLAGAYNNRGIAYRNQGKLDAAITDLDKAMELYDVLVHKGNHLELRDGLAMAYNNRGLALTDQGKLELAIDDLDKAVELRETLVYKENRLELRNSLAGAYNDRGGALAAQDKLDAAVADCAKAIELYENLVHKENRTELAGDLAKAMFNRALAYREMDRLADAEQDMLRGATLLREMVRNGLVHLLPNFLQTTDALTGLLTELHKPEQAVQWVNEALEMLVREIQADRITEVLEREAKRFCAFVASMIKRVGASTHPTAIDVEAFVTACKALGIIPEEDQPPAGSNET